MNEQPTSERTPLEEVAALLRGQRNRWRKWFAVAGVVLVAVIINQVRISNVASDAKDAASKAQEAIDASVAQRGEARLAACLSYNEDLAEIVNGLNDEVQQLAIDAFADPTGRRTRAESLAVDQFLAAKIAAFDARKVPRRDCTPQGIEDFYARRAAQQAPDGLVGGSDLPTTTTTAAAPTQRATTSTRAATSTTARSTSTTFRSSPSTSDAGCEVLPGVTIPKELPCL